MCALMPTLWCAMSLVACECIVSARTVGTDDSKRSDGGCGQGERGSVVLQQHNALVGGTESKCSVCFAANDVGCDVGVRLCTGIGEQPQSELEEEEEQPIRRQRIVKTEETHNSRQCA